MEVFLVVLGLMLGAAVFSLVAAGSKKDKYHDDDLDRTDVVSDDVRLVQSCNELKQLAARVRKETKHG